MKHTWLLHSTLAAVLVIANCDTFGRYPWTKDAPNSVLATVRRVPSQYPTIQAGIDASGNGDTVLVSDGTYYENIRFKGKKIVVASTFLTTGDTSHISRTVIDGSRAVLADSASVVYFISGEDTNSVLCGFTVRGGTGTSSGTYRQGGGVLCSSGARLVRNIITGNNLSGGELWGGGVSGDAGQTLIMEQNIVKGNTLNGTWAGGAGVMVYGMKAIIRNNIIADNTVTTQGAVSGSFGAGIHCEIGTFIIDGNLITGNRALAPTASNPSYGGGVFVREGNLDFRNNRVIGNVLQSSSSMRAYGGGLSLLAAAASELTEMGVAGNYIASNTVIGGSSGARLSGGGGIFSRDQRPRIENNIIVKNTAPYGGGFGAERFYTTSKSVLNTLPHEGVVGRERVPSVRETSTHSSIIVDAPLLINNTIAYNRATLDGGAISTSGAWTPKVINTIAWGDTGTTEIALFDGSGIRVLFSDIQGGWPSDFGNIADSIRFVPGDTLYNLQAASPCIGRGIDSIQVDGIWYHAPAYDFDGHARHRPSGPQNCDIGAQEEQTTVDVTTQESSPTSYELSQNFPNPFNPATIVRYQLPVAGYVRLVVYDVLGREVAILVNQKREQGSYEVKWDGSNVSSGMYICRMTAGEYTETRKMLLTK
jgi:hypothetical protein